MVIKNFGNPKNVFLEALFLTIVVFALGLLVGVAYEGARIDKVNEYYARSEISLMDAFALSNLVESSGSSEECDMLVKANIDFADRIYEEARILEQYDDSGTINDGTRLAHEKYDLLRTILWTDSSKVRSKCPGRFSSVVYLYEFETDSINTKATQTVWSRILFDLKQEKGDEIILIPIAVDSDLASLGLLAESYSIENFPVVIINDEFVIDELTSVDDLRVYLG